MPDQPDMRNTPTAQIPQGGAPIAGLETFRVPLERLRASASGPFGAKPLIHVVVDNLALIEDLRLPVPPLSRAPGL